MKRHPPCTCSVHANEPSRWCEEHGVKVPKPFRMSLGDRQGWAIPNMKAERWEFWAYRR